MTRYIIMTYAYLKKYSVSTDKSGFYIDGPNWTLQTTHEADRFFRQSTHYRNDTQLPLTVVKALVHLGEAKTGGRERKSEILGWFPQLNPDFCDMSQDQLADLQDFIASIAGSEESNSSEFNDFLRLETPLTPV